VKNCYRVENRLDIVPKLPPPELPPSLNYQHVLSPYELNPADVLLDISCEHSLTTYLHLLSLQSGGAVIPLDPACGKPSVAENVVPPVAAS